MKLLRYFDSFLPNTVNLNQSRLDDLDDRVKAITNFLEGDEHEIGRLFVQTIPQGSYAHRTIIKPVGPNDEFDADLLIELEEDTDWSPADYVQELYSSFRASSTYKEMVERRTRCVTVTYANRFHVDVVPYLERHSEHYITNRKTDEFELTNPEGFNAWLEEKNRVANGHLVKVIRLVKYLRDYKNTFSVPSVILSILLAERVNDAALLGDPQHYQDVPTVLNNVLAALDDYLQANIVLPTIADPSCPTESFNHRWDQEGYSNFRKWINYYSEKVADAFAETDKATSLATWQEVFGEEFKAPESTEAKSAAATLGRARDTEQFLERDLRVPLRLDHRHVLRIGGRVLPKAGWRHYPLRSRGNAVEKGRTIRFTIERNTVPKPYHVYWKVKNHGEEAIRADCIRGQIIPDQGLERKDEPTAYRGDHYVECYIVKDGVCVTKDLQPVIVK